MHGITLTPAVAGSARRDGTAPAPRPAPVRRFDSRDAPGRLDFEEYVTARGADLVRLARGLLRDPQHAEDLVQDVLVRAHLKWATITAATSPDAYVYRMVVNASTSFWRRAARREQAVDTDRLPVAGIPDAAARLGERDLMVSLLRQLPAKQRAVLVLRHYEGMPDVEIAELLGTSAVTVRSNAHRGLAALRRMLEELHVRDGGA